MVTLTRKEAVFVTESPKLIVMLTHHDRTVKNAWEMFEHGKETQAEFWGMKEDPLPLGEMKELYAHMRDCGKRTVLEVVAYQEDKCLAGAEMAVECGCEILMGTMFYDSVNEFCKANGVKYMPFVGNIMGRPSVLRGTKEDMVREAERCLEKGTYGIDLLGYRYIGDAEALNRTLVSQVHGPVCIAGSVDSYQRLDQLKNIAPWAFTIGGAFFEGRFGGDFCEQINRVCAYMKG